KLRGGCVLRFGDPLDPFGNSVDAQGCSLTPLGPTIDPASYVRSRGEAMLDPARDAAYTRELGELLVERLRAETVLMSTSLVAHLLFRRLVALTPGMDLFARLRLRGEVSISREELERRTERARAALLELEEQGRVRLSRFLHEASGAQIVSRALAAWQGYHSRTAAKDLGVEITADDPTLLLYYQNRLVPFAEDIADEDERLAAREIGMLELLGATR
ncbi:MAG: hypothetical protein OEY14_15370, partial [Myxococcales bacterium]|nr:hypothetical protein [Myxococcales bacterium]